MGCTTGATGSCTPAGGGHGRRHWVVPLPVLLRDEDLSTSRANPTLSSRDTIPVGADLDPYEALTRNATLTAFHES